MTRTTAFNFALTLLAFAFLAAPSAVARESSQDAPAAPADPYAQPPHWPVGFKFAPELVRKWGDKRAAKMLKSKDADVLLWTPPESKQIRAVLMLANNTDLVKIGEHKRVREVAAKHDIAIMFLQHFSGQIVEFARPPSPELARETFDAMLNTAAEKTGIEEFRHAPWITVGKSSRGQFPFHTTWLFPHRVIASISYHGQTPTWPIADWAAEGVADQSVMHLNIQGLSEWDGTWYRHVRPMLLNYNQHTDWLAHQVVIYGVDHGYYVDYYIYPNFQKRMDKNHRFTRVGTVWDYVAAHIDTAMTLRVPADSYPTDRSTKLKAVDRASGYLIHPRAIEELLGTKWFAFRRGDDGDYDVIPWPDEVTPVYDKEQGRITYDKLIVPAADVPEAQRGQYMWIANRDMARHWLQLHNLYKLADRVLPPAEKNKN